MKECFKELFKDEDWIWNNLTDALVEEFGWSEATEVISCMVKRRLLIRLLQEGNK